MVPATRPCTAESGEEGIARAKQIKPDLVLMDVVMPGTNGFQASARCRRTMTPGHPGHHMYTTKNQKPIKSGECARAPRTTSPSRSTDRRCRRKDRRARIRWQTHQPARVPAERLRSAPVARAANACLASSRAARNFRGGSHWLIDLADSARSRCPRDASAADQALVHRHRQHPRRPLQRGGTFALARRRANPLNAQSRLVLVGARHEGQQLRCWCGVRWD